MDRKKEIGDLIRRAREARGWSQAQLAAETRVVTASAIGNYEQGTRVPKLPQARALARVLEIPLHRLVGVEQASGLTAEEEELLSRWRAADTRGRAAIAAVAKSLTPTGTKKKAG